jgi:hypothetical protein
MTDEIPYSVIRTLEDIEIRAYPSIILATVHGRGDSGAFGVLFRYITGSNQSQRTIPMTAPVVSAGKGGENVSMTAPVISDRDRFSFVLPASYTMDTAPVPLDPRVQLVPIPPRHVAVLRFRGWASPRQVRYRTEDLLHGLRQAGIEPLGAPFLMRYNPPFTPGFLRRNEVGAEIDT